MVDYFRLMHGHGPLGRRPHTCKGKKELVTGQARAVVPGGGLDAGVAPEAVAAGLDDGVGGGEREDVGAGHGDAALPVHGVVDVLDEVQRRLLLQALVLDHVLHAVPPPGRPRPPPTILPWPRPSPAAVVAGGWKGIRPSELAARVALAATTL